MTDLLPPADVAHNLRVASRLEMLGPCQATNATRRPWASRLYDASLDASFEAPGVLSLRLRRTPTRGHALPLGEEARLELDLPTARRVAWLLRAWARLPDETRQGPAPSVLRARLKGWHRAGRSAPVQGATLELGGRTDGTMWLHAEISTDQTLRVVLPAPSRVGVELARMCAPRLDTFRVIRGGEVVSTRGLPWACAGLAITERPDQSGRWHLTHLRTGCHLGVVFERLRDAGVFASGLALAGLSWAEPTRDQEALVDQRVRYWPGAVEPLGLCRLLRRPRRRPGSCLTARASRATPQERQVCDGG